MTAAEATTTAPTESGRTLALGVSQIFLQENWIAGLTMLMGFALYSVPMALLVALGAPRRTILLLFLGEAVALVRFEAWHGTDRGGDDRGMMSAQDGHHNFSS